MKFLSLVLGIAIPMLFVKSALAGLIMLPPPPSGFVWASVGTVTINGTFTGGVLTQTIGPNSLNGASSPGTNTADFDLDWSVSHSTPVGTGEAAPSSAGQNAYVFQNSNYSSSSILNVVSQGLGGLYIADNSNPAGNGDGTEGNEEGTFRVDDNVSGLTLSVTGAATNSAGVGTYNNSNTFGANTDEDGDGSSTLTSVEAAYDSAVVGTVTTGIDLARISGDGAFNPLAPTISGSQSTDFLSTYDFGISGSRLFDVTELTGNLANPEFGGTSSIWSLAHGTTIATWSYDEFVLVAVPEPTTFMMFSAAVLGLGFCRRR